MKATYIIIKDITRKSTEVRTFKIRRNALDCFNAWNDEQGVYPKAFVKEGFFSKKRKLNWDELYTK